MIQISGGGAFTRQNISDINSNFASVTVPDIWVRPQYGNNNTADGSYDKPFATIAGALSSSLCVPGVVIGLLGVTTEEVSTAIINDITIVGMANQARQATTSGAPNGGGATWLSPTGGTGTLLTINGQGWKIQNIYFNNTGGTASTTACIKLVGGGDPPLTADSGHTQILDCVITGEANGILFSGGPGFVTIARNKIFLFDSSGDKGIASEAGSPGGGTGWGAVIHDNNFTANLTHINAGSTAYGWQVFNNRFSYIDVGVTTTTQIAFSGGSNNSVHNNYFDLPYSTNGITAMFTLGTNDRWYFNEFGTAVTTTIYSFGAPAS